MTEPPSILRAEAVTQPRRQAKLWQQLLAVVILATACLLAGYGCGRSIDCGPGPTYGEGQCGLGTFMGILADFVGFLVTLAVGVSVVLIRRARSRTIE